MACAKLIPLSWFGRSARNSRLTRSSGHAALASGTGDFGFTDIIYKVATRPDKRIGSDESWDKAEHALMDSMRSSG